MEKQLQLKKIGCSNCGAELIFDPGTQMTNCNFCGSQFQIENAQDEEIVTPDGILPFKVSKEIYENSVLSWLSEGDYTPDDILHTTIFDSVNGVYLPMWFFKGRYNGNWSASSGYDRWEEYLDRDSSGKLQRKTRRVTDWRPSSGQIGGEFAILGFAGQGKGIKGSIATYAHNTSFERGDIKPYDPKYTLGFNLIDFTKDDIDTWEAIGKPQANALATADGENRVPGDRHKDFYCDVLYTQEKSLRLYLPFWITTYTYEEKEFFVYMDGTTATRIEGVRPVDEARKKEVNKKFIPGHIALVLFVISVFIVTNQDNYDAKENWEAITKFIALVMLILYCVGFYQKNKIIKTSKEKRQRILDAVKNGQSIDDVLKDYDQPRAVESTSIGPKKNKINTRYLIISGVIVLIIGVISFLFSMNNSNESSQSSDSLLRDSVVANNSNIIEESNSNNSNYVESVLNIERVESTGEYSSNNITYTAQNMVDGDYGTWWTPDPTNGSQSAATFFFENTKKCNVGALKIINGSYGKYYFDNSRITQIKVSFENGESEIADLTDLQDYQRIEFANKHLTSFVKIEPINRTNGNRWDDICISEIQFLGNRGMNASSDNDVNSEETSLLICGSFSTNEQAEQLFNSLSQKFDDIPFKIIQTNAYPNLKPNLYCIVLADGKGSDGVFYEDSDFRLLEAKKRLGDHGISSYIKSAY